MPYRSHGDGQFDASSLASCGEDCIFEQGSMVFHPDRVFLGRGVYLGHYAILKGYYRGIMRIGDACWIGQHCFLHSAGDITLGTKVGVGPGVQILTSQHQRTRRTPLLDAPLDFAPVIIEDGVDIGAGAIILPGVTIGQGAQIGAGAVVNRSVSAFMIAAGVPARVIGEIDP